MADFLEPQVIPDQPIPALNTNDADTSTTAPSVTDSSISGDSVSPASMGDKSISQPPIATDIVGTSLDTQTRRILGQFSFGQVGSLQIGSYVNGSSGDIRITPNGITARDQTGVTTFALDGTTGNATFRGTVQAGSLISGNLTLGGAGNGNGVLTIQDNSGVTKAVGNNTGFIVYDAGSFQFAATGAGVVATLGADGSGHVLFQPQGPGVEFRVGGSGSVGSDWNVGGTVSSSTLNNTNRVTTHDLTVTNTAILIGGVIKSAIVPTTQGFRALYCAEAPEVWFFDFCDSPEAIDPMFLEVTEGEMHFLQTMGGKCQVWRRRKNFADKRFELKTALDFRKNNDFWGQPQR